MAATVGSALILSGSLVSFSALGSRRAGGLFFRSMVKPELIWKLARFGAVGIGVMFVFMGLFAGYFSARLYKSFRGEVRDGSRSLEESCILLTLSC